MGPGRGSAAQQTLIHFGPAEAERESGGSKPGAGHADVAAIPRIENSFRERRRSGRKHLIGDRETFKVPRAFGRDKFSAQLGSRKFLLFGKQNARATPGQVIRRAGAGRAAAGDDDVVGFHVRFDWSASVLACGVATETVALQSGSKGDYRR